MQLANNKYISESDLRALHDDLVQWSLYCNNYDAEAAMDVVQQSYLKLVSGKAYFDKKSALKTWLFSVVRLTSFEQRRKSTVHGVQLRSIDSEDVNLRSDRSEDDDARDEVENMPQCDNVFALDAHTEQEVALAIKQLSLMQREIVYLAFYKDMTLAEIALILGVSLGTVSTQYHRAKTKLSRLLSVRSPEWKIN